MKSLRRVRELTNPESLRLFSWSLVAVFLAIVLLRTRKLPEVLDYLARPSRARASKKTRSEPDVRSVDQVRRYSHAIITRLLRSRRPCLLRSLVLYRYCWKHGVPVSIHFGVRSDIDGLKGHSWVTLDGAPLGELEEGLRPYADVYSYPTDTDGADPQQALAAVGWQP